MKKYNAEKQYEYPYFKPGRRERPPKEKRPVKKQYTERAVFAIHPLTDIKYFILNKDQWGFSFINEHGHKQNTAFGVMSIDRVVGNVNFSPYKIIQEKIEKC